MTPPNSKKRLFKKAYAKELMMIAAGDLASALVLAEANSGRPENIVFLVQQSVEKNIKAVLVHLQIAFPIVHDLGILIALLPDDQMPPEGFGLTELNPFATVRRYEEGQLPLTREEIEACVTTARTVAAWTESILSN